MSPLRLLALSLSLAYSAHVLAEECNRLFEVPLTYRFGVNMQQVVTADFDGDARPDVAVAAAPSVHILLNRDGVLVRATPAATPAAPLNLFTTEADGDGRTDLVSYGAAFIATHYSAGDATFRTITTAVTGNSLLGVGALADMNGDGRADLLAVAQGAGGRTLRVFAGNANGTFTSLAETPLDRSPMRIAAGDWNRDGKADVVVTSGAGTAAMLHPGQGNGTFDAPQAVLPEVVTSAGAVAAGDFDGDGVEDLVIAGYGMSALFLSTRGAEPIAAEVPVGNSNLSAFDVDRDGKLDLVDDLIVAPGNGDGTFRRQLTTAWYLPVHGGGLGRDPDMADLDGDGTLDMIAAGGGNLVVRYGRGNFRFDGGQVLLMDIDRAVAADVNEDGRDDLITFAYANMVFLSGPGGMLAEEPKAMGNGSSGPGVVADFNGDSHLDLASTANWIAFGDGMGNFTAPRNLVDQNTWGSVLDVVAADANGDGSTDVVFATSEDLRILINDGTGRFTVTERTGTLLDLATGDFNRDGKPDLLAVSGDALVLLPGGTESPVTLLRGVQPGPFAGGSGLEAVDVDGDGLLDAVVLTASGTELLVLGGNGNGTFRTPLPVPISGTGSVRDGYDFGAFTAADFTGDGRIDLLAAPYQREARLLAQQADGTFVEVARLGVPNFSVTSGDFDGDGHADLLGRNSTGTTIYRSRCREEMRASPPLVGITASSSRTSVTIRAIVPATAAGRVQFYRRSKSENYFDVVSIGTAAVVDGMATLTAELPVGTYEIDALYFGGGAYSRSYSRTIDVQVSGEAAPAARRRSVRH